MKTEKWVLTHNARETVDNIDKAIGLLNNVFGGDVDEGQVIGACSNTLSDHDGLDLLLEHYHRLEQMTAGRGDRGFTLEASGLDHEDLMMMVEEEYLEYQDPWEDFQDGLVILFDRFKGYINGRDLWAEAEGVFRTPHILEHPQPLPDELREKVEDCNSDGAITPDISYMKSLRQRILEHLEII